MLNELFNSDVFETFTFLSSFFYKEHFTKKIKSPDQLDKKFFFLSGPSLYSIYASFIIDF